MEPSNGRDRKEDLNLRELHAKNVILQKEQSNSKE